VVSNPLRPLRETARARPLRALARLLVSVAKRRRERQGSETGQGEKEAAAPSTPCGATAVIDLATDRKHNAHDSDPEQL
jgi:hypothetical protein